jgi:hypothetical protein
MKKIKIRDRKIWAIAGKILFGLVLVSMVGGLSPLPALGEDYRRGGPPDRDRYEHRDRDRGRDAYYHRRVYRDYHTTRRVYAPPTVVFEPPPPPPGISIFFPFMR